MLAIRDQKTFVAGLFLAAFGALALYLSLQYRLGTARDMGPGYFPAVVSGLLALTGVVAVIRSALIEGEHLPVLSWKPAIYVTAGIIGFGLLLERAGVALALLALIMIASLAHRGLRARTAVGIALALIIFSSLVFVRWLSVPVPILRGII